MKEFHGHASARFDVAPRQVFDLIIDVDRLPEWNGAIEEVLERPPILEESTQWVVRMHPPHMPSWGRVSRVQEVDRHNWRFAYETRNADGNPSYTKWTWTVADSGDGAELDVSWDVYLKTIDRRVLAGPLRRRQLQREVTNSLASIADAVKAPE